MIASPFLVMGVVMVLVGICMSTVGFCCLKCWPRDKGGYSRCSRWWPALLVLVLAVFLLYVPHSSPTLLMDASHVL